MTHEHFVSIYSRSYPSVLADDLVSTYTGMRYLYDPIPLRGDVSTFNKSLIWVRENLRTFRSVSDGIMMQGEWGGSLGRHMAAIAAIDSLSDLDDLIKDKPVAFMPGSEDWYLDIVASTKKVFSHVLRGESKIIGRDYFEGQIEPNSTTATIEILHQLLTCEDLVDRVSGNDREFQLGLIIQAKDILYRVLMQSYLVHLRSRAHNNEW